MGQGFVWLDFCYGLLALLPLEESGLKNIEESGLKDWID